MKYPFRSITVYVEWRCQSQGVPDDRLIRARVCETETHSGGRCRQLGDELIAPRKITDRQMSQAHTICLQKLRGLTNRVIFQYEMLMGLEPEEFPCNANVEVA